MWHKARKFTSTTSLSYAVKARKARLVIVLLDPLLHTPPNTIVCRFTQIFFDFFAMYRAESYTQWIFLCSSYNMILRYPNFSLSSLGRHVNSWLWHLLKFKYFAVACLARANYAPSETIGNVLAGEVTLNSWSKLRGLSGIQAPVGGSSPYTASCCISS